MSGSAEQPAPPSAQPDFLDPSLWHALRTATGTAGFHRAWLALACAQIEGLVRAVVIVPGEDGRTFRPSAFHPARFEPSQELAGVVAEAVEGRCGVIREAGGGSEGRAILLAYPVSPNTDDHAPALFVILQLAWRDGTGLERVKRTLQWSSAWLGLGGSDSRSLASGTAHAVSDTEALADALLRCASADEAAHQLVNALCARFGCERASLGLARGSSIRIAAVSNTSRINHRSQMSVALAAAIGEAVDQFDRCAWPTTEAGLVGHAQQSLCETFGAQRAVSLPFGTEARGLGGVVLEFDSASDWRADALDAMQSAVALTGSIVASRFASERHLGQVVRDDLLRLLRGLLGWHRPLLKLGIASAALALIVLALASDTHRVSATARLEGLVQRAIVAPFDGFVAAAYRRAGDRVEAGEPIAALDEHELRRERSRLVGQVREYATAHTEAMASGNRVEALLNIHRRSQAEASLADIEARLARAQLVAPIAGIIISGDLSQSIDAPLTRGDVLFEIAPLDGRRAIVEVDERDVGWIEPGSTGTLRLSGFPHRTFDVEVERVGGASRPQAGTNVFPVEARVRLATGDDVMLLPGMEGVVKLDAGQRSLLWIWTHESLDWLRLQLWHWLP